MVCAISARVCVCLHVCSGFRIICMQSDNHANILHCVLRLGERLQKNLWTCMCLTFCTNWLCCARKSAARTNIYPEQMKKMTYFDPLLVLIYRQQSIHKATSFHLIKVRVSFTQAKGHCRTHSITDHHMQGVTEGWGQTGNRRSAMWIMQAPYTPYMGESCIKLHASVYSPLLCSVVSHPEPRPGRPGPEGLHT